MIVLFGLCRLPRPRRITHSTLPTRRLTSANRLATYQERSVRQPWRRLLSLFSCRSPVRRGCETLAQIASTILVGACQGSWGVFETAPAEGTDPSAVEIHGRCVAVISGVIFYRCLSTHHQSGPGISYSLQSLQKLSVPWAREGQTDLP